MLRAYALGRCIRGERMSEMSTTFFEAQGGKQEKGVDKSEEKVQEQDKGQSQSNNNDDDNTTPSKTTTAVDSNTFPTTPSSSSPVTAISLEDTLMDIAKAFKLQKLILPPPRTDWLGESTSSVF